MWRRSTATSEGDPRAPHDVTRRWFVKCFSWLVTAVMSGVIGELIGRGLPGGHQALVPPPPREIHVASSLTVSWESLQTVVSATGIETDRPTTA